SLLAALVERIRAGGEHPADYVDIGFKVPERKYTAWPTAIREAFAAARTVRTAKPTFRLTIKPKDTRCPALLPRPSPARATPRAARSAAGHERHAGARRNPPRTGGQADRGRHARRYRLRLAGCRSRVQRGRRPPARLAQALWSRPAGWGARE